MYIAYRDRAGGSASYPSKHFKLQGRSMAKRLGQGKVIGSADAWAWPQEEAHSSTSSRLSATPSMQLLLYSSGRGNIWLLRGVCFLMLLATRSSMASEHETCPGGVTWQDRSLETAPVLCDEQAAKESIEGRYHMTDLLCLPMSKCITQPVESPLPWSHRYCRLLPSFCPEKKWTQSRPCSTPWTLIIREPSLSKSSRVACATLVLNLPREKSNNSWKP